jgi:ribose transport system permease protein
MTTAEAAQPIPATTAFLHRRSVRFLLDNIVWAILLVALAFFSLTIPGYFGTNVFINIVYHGVPIGLLAIGETFVLITGNMDLSIEPVAGFAAITSAWLSGTSLYASGLALDPALSLAICLGVGALVGFINATIILRFNVDSFLATLSTFIIMQGLSLVLTNGTGVSMLPDSFRLVDTVRILGVPLMVYLMLVLYAGFYFMLTRTQFGRHLFVVGGNPDAAYNFGISVRSVVLKAYLLCGLLAGLAGWIIAARTNGATPTAATGYLFDTLAAVVIGGVSLKGGFGSLVGVFGGVLLLSSVSTALNLMDVSPFVVSVIRGSLVLFAVILDAMKRRLR